MAVQSNEPARFGRESPVLRHWLENSTGFRVHGACRGVVERVYGLPGATTSIAVRRRLRRRVLVPADEVAEVVPEQELLIVAPAASAQPRTKRPPRVYGRRAGAVTRRGAVTAGTTSRSAAATSWRAAARAAAVVATLAVLAARAGLRILRDAGLSLRELAAWGWPVARRLAREWRLHMLDVAARANRALRQAQARRRRERLARSLEAMVAALGRDRGSSNGHVSARSEAERPRVKQ